MWESDRLVEFAVSRLGEMAFSQEVLLFENFGDWSPWPFLHVLSPNLVLRAMWESDRLVEFAVSPLGEVAFSQKVMQLENFDDWTPWPFLHLLSPKIWF